MFKNFLICLMVISVLSGCIKKRSQNLHEKGIPSAAKWIVLPFKNDTGHNNINYQVERMLTVMLPSIGIENAQINPLSLKFDPKIEEHLIKEDLYKKEIKDLIIWANQKNISFAISGVIEDWSVSKDSIPKISMSLQVLDIKNNNKRIWYMQGLREGEIKEDPYNVARILIKKMLDTIPIGKN